MTTYTSTATTDGWILTATSANGRTTYTIKEPNGALIYNGPNPTGDIRKDSSLTSFNKELFAPFGAENFTGLSIKGIRNAFVSRNDNVNTLLASLGQMVQTTNADIKTQQTSVAPESAPILNQGSIATPVLGPMTIEPRTFSNPGGLPIVDTLDVEVRETLDEPPTTTNPSNHLPLGDEIDDIYDPNLTPEQVASLSAEDQEIRAEVLESVARRGFADPEADGSIVVTGSRPNFQDWRVKLSLAPSATYLYNADPPGILAPLAQTKGVIFPYTPQISVNYSASYEPSTVIHSNYKVYQYSNSAVDSVTIMCEFTAQDTREADYLLAVIHFFRSLTKMFFGQDENPRAGTPPPLCYLKGMGSYQFSEHPLAITGFTYNLPNDVDYIKTIGPTISGFPLPVPQLSVTRLPDNIIPGGRPAPPDFTTFALSPLETNEVTWVPTKIQITLMAIPIISRNQMSQDFSLKEYATGYLLNGKNNVNGGFW